MTVEIAATRRPRWPGSAAFGFGILTVLATGTGVTAASLESFELAVILAGAALVVSALAVVGGLVAAIGNWNRGAAIGGIALGLVGNPLVQTYGLGALGSV